MNIISKIIAGMLNVLRKILASSPKLQVMLYNMRNVGEFEDLYEHEKMLADSVRVNSYKRAIAKLVNPGDMVLDLGTGTGILSFFASMSKPEKVYAIDHSGFIEVAREIARHNKFENIEFIQTHSRNFNPEVKFDVILHEQMGDYLFNENMLQNLLDLKKRLLKRGGKIVPGKFELYLEPVQLKSEFDVPFIWENNLYGVDFSFLKDYYEQLEQYQPSDYKLEWLESDSVKNYLCAPEPALSFDLNEITSAEDVPLSLEICRQLEKAGTLNGFCLYFKTIFDDEISFSTSPMAATTHWGSCFFRVENRKCNGREMIGYTFTMRDLLDIKTWSVSVNKFHEKVANVIDAAD